MSDHVDAHVRERYTIEERLGKGAYGIVWKAVDKETGEIVAVKKIFDAFRNITDAQRTFREIMYLQAFSDHDNVVTLLNVLRADNEKDFYLIFGHMDTDLHVVIRGRLLLDVHVRYVIYQLLLALAYMHSGQVIHRDLKPSNVLLNDNCDVRLADFGLARSVAIDPDRKDVVDPTMTDYVATRWYRAPEILLGSQTYTTNADMWSLGCILGEMLIARPLFQGSSSLNQVDVILRCLGRPSAADVAAMHSPYAETTVTRMQFRPGPSLDSMLAAAPADGIDLVKRMLHCNPQKRISALDALKHPYVAKFINPAVSVKLCTSMVRTPIDDNRRLTIDDYRIHLYKEVALRCQAIVTFRAAMLTSRQEAGQAAMMTPRITVPAAPSNESKMGTTAASPKAAAKAVVPSRPTATSPVKSPTKVPSAVPRSSVASKPLSVAAVAKPVLTNVPAPAPAAAVLSAKPFAIATANHLASSGASFVAAPVKGQFAPAPLAHLQPAARSGAWVTAAAAQATRPLVTSFTSAVHVQESILAAQPLKLAEGDSSVALHKSASIINALPPPVRSRGAPIVATPVAAIGKTGSLMTAAVRTVQAPLNRHSSLGHMTTSQYKAITKPW